MPMSAEALDPPPFEVLPRRRVEIDWLGHETAPRHAWLLIKGQQNRSRPELSGRRRLSAFRAEKTVRSRVLDAPVYPAMPIDMNPGAAQKLNSASFAPIDRWRLIPFVAVFSNRNIMRASCIRATCNPSNGTKSRGVKHCYSNLPEKTPDQRKWGAVSRSLSGRSKRLSVG